MFQDTKLDLAQITADPQYNTRENYDWSKDGDLEQLMGMIKALGGLLYPLIVIPTPVDGEGNPTAPTPYILIAGFRRYYSLEQLAINEKDQAWVKGIEVKVAENKTEAECLAIQMMENVGRKDQTVMETARGLAFLAGTQNPPMTHAQLVKQTGMTPSVVSNYMNLLKLDSTIQEMIDTPTEEGGLPYSHARLLSSSRVPEDQKYKLARIGCGMPYGEFKKKLDALFPVTKATEEADAANPDSDQQKHARSMRIKSIETKYIPYLDRLIEKAPDDSKKSELAAMKKGFLWAIDPTKNPEIEALFKPLVDADEAKQQAEEAQAEADKVYKTYLGQMLKVINQTINVNVEPGQRRPGLEEGLANVKATLQKDIADDKMPIPLEAEDIDAFVAKDVTEAYHAQVKQRNELKAKRDAKKAEEAAKKAAADPVAAAGAAVEGETNVGNNAAAAEGGKPAEAAASEGAAVGTAG